MKLFHTPTSPFVRKVMVAAHETGLLARIETELLRPSPLATDAKLSAHNPLSKIPVLVLDDGSSLFDSRVICEYFDTLHAGPKLVPASGPERWRVLSVQALGDGLVEAGIQIFYERVHRPKELHFAVWLDGQAQKVRQALDHLNAHVSMLSGPIDLGQITVACAIGWLELREVIPSIREGRAPLFAWYDQLRERPSMKATQPAV